MGILQENTLKSLQGNLIKTVMGIDKTCRTPLFKALKLSHIPSIALYPFNLKLLNTIMKRYSAARQFNLLMIKINCEYSIIV